MDENVVGGIVAKVMLAILGTWKGWVAREWRGDNGAEATEAQAKALLLGIDPWVIWVCHSLA